VPTKFPSGTVGNSTPRLEDDGPDKASHWDGWEAVGQDGEA